MISKTLMTDAFFEGSPTQRDYQRVFYAVLLGAALVHRVSPLSAAYRAAELPSPLFTPPPIVARLARLFSSGRRIPEVLLVAKATVLACWAVCIADVSGSAWPRVALFAGMCVLQATTRACSCSHSGPRSSARSNLTPCGAPARLASDVSPSTRALLAAAGEPGQGSRVGQVRARARVRVRVRVRVGVGVSGERVSG